MTNNKNSRLAGAGTCSEGNNENSGGGASLYALVVT